MVKARLNIGGLSNRLIEDRIRRKHPDAPSDLKRYALFEWFVNVTPHPDAPRLKRAKQKASPVVFDEFLKSFEWRRLRMQVIVERGAKCECCGATPADGQTVINVDHVKPRKLHPELALDKTNLQVLCHVCNHGKGNWNQTDWRAS